MTMLDELDAKQLLSGCGISVNQGIAVHNGADAAGAAAKLGFPVVLKVLSGKITHKSDLGLVALDVPSEDCARGAYDRIIATAKTTDPDASVVVETMAGKGLEVIVGAKRDPQFGPTVLFGLGGTFVEVFKDVSIRVAPVEIPMARGMMKDIKGHVLLEGFRGKKGVDRDALADIIVKVSKLMMSREDIMELDINPVIASEKGAVAVDARILLKDSSPGRNTNYRK
jgi:acyl-CoA synthetase (NDP forming)